MGAIRCSRIARYLSSKGHEVRVITAKSPFVKSPASIPEDAFVIHYVNNYNFSTILELKQKKKGEMENRWSQPSKLSGVKNYLRKKLSKIPTGIFYTFLPWLIGSRVVVRSNLVGWSPDVVYCSCLPFSAALLGVWVKKQFGVPLIIEFRDLWHGNPYSHLPSFVNRISGFIEKYYVKNCDQLITVSKPLKDYLEVRYSEIPCDVVLTGFDRVQCDLDKDNFSFKNEKLKIFYGGSVYGGKRSPEKLFEALSRCPQDVLNQVEIIFAGDGLDHVRNMVVQSNLGSHVRFLGQVSYEESLFLSKSADLGLVLTWDSQLDEGSVPGKIFDFVGAQTPIIYLGYELGAAAALITQYRLGWVVSDVSMMQELIVTWVEEKKRSGHISFKVGEVSEGLSSEKQFEKIESICFSAKEALSRN